MKNIFKKVLLVCVAFLALAGIVFLGSITINDHLRFQFLETFSHYACKLSGAQVVVCGDSIAAGGRHWAGNIDLPPLRTRNLAGNGYTISQITGQVEEAKKYNPGLLVVFGGTNDAFQLRDGRTTLPQIQNDMVTLIEKSMPVKMVYVLPPPSVYPDVNSTLAEVRSEIREVLEGEGIAIVDSAEILGDENGILRPEFSSDGIHLTAKAYEVIGDEIIKSKGAL
jgi:lysophospholipase L1-like esterase